MRRTFFSCLLSSLYALTLTAGPLEDYWNRDGAEISTYTLTQERYGREHPAEAILLFVTEPFLSDQQVKHEFGPDDKAVQVLKLNAFRRFPTGLYDYSVMASIFSPLEAKARHPYKLNLSVQDWCGQVYVQLNRQADERLWKWQQFSYFQAEGDASGVLKEGWLEDGLWLTLRLAPKQLPLGEIRLIPALLERRFSHKPFQYHTAEASLSQVVRESGKHLRYTLEYQDLARSLSIDFEAAFPHRILGWTESGKRGEPVTRATLLKTIRSEYWNENKPRDRKLRESLSLPTERL